MERIVLENYLKTVYRLSENNAFMVTNKKIADSLEIIPATVTEAVKKLSDEGYIHYEKSYGVKLSMKGQRRAIQIVRRHRLWETFLVKELGFSWDEVHEVAEELEHVANDKLIAKISQKLGNPMYDPHGEPIPNEFGKVKKNKFQILADIKKTPSVVQLVGVRDDASAFLKYCQQKKLILQTQFELVSINEYDGTRLLMIHRKKTTITEEVAQKLLVEF